METARNIFEMLSYTKNTGVLVSQSQMRYCEIFQSEAGQRLNHPKQASQRLNHPKHLNACLSQSIKSENFSLRKIELDVIFIISFMIV